MHKQLLLVVVVIAINPTKKTPSLMCIMHIMIMITIRYVWSHYMHTTLRDPTRTEVSYYGAKRIGM